MNTFHKNLFSLIISVHLLINLYASSQQEFKAFKYAYLCASFPVLGVPDPPSPCSPSPPSSPIDSACTLVFPLATPHLRPPTPHSLHDSGVEAELDDAGSAIPTETLCGVVRRAFRLPHDRVRYYEKQIGKTYCKKTPSQVTVKVLVMARSRHTARKHPHR